MIEKNDIQLSEAALFNELSSLIEQSKAQVVSQVNSAMTLLFWQLGKRINKLYWKIRELNMANKLSLHCRDN